MANIKANSLMYIAVLRACARKLALTEGRLIHADIRNTGFEANLYVVNSLIDMYCKCGSMNEAQAVFNTLPKRNVVSWTTLIAGYAQHGHCQKSLELFRNMEQEGITPNKVTFLSVIRACSTVGEIHEGKIIHAQLVKSGMELDSFVGSALVDMYAKCGHFPEAQAVLYSIRDRNVVCWTALIAGCAQHGFGREALFLYQRMQEEGVKPNRVTQLCALKACGTIGALHQGQHIHAQILKSGDPVDSAIGNTLIDMYVQCGSLEKAKRVFDQMKSKDVGSWSAMVAAYAHSRYPCEAVQVFQQMEHDGVVANSIAYANVLKACGNAAALDQGKRFHVQLIRKDACHDRFVDNTLIDMYIKCGSFEEAKMVFDQLLERDVVAWTSIIAGFDQHGNSQEAIQHFNQMQQEGVEPDRISFVTVLKACRSLEALEEGKRIHAQLKENFLDRNLCVGSVLVDMYSKCSNLEEALDVFTKLAKRDVVAWNAMIAGHTDNGDHEEAQKRFQEMQEGGTEPDRITFLTILKLCGSITALDQGKQIHATLVARGLLSDPIVVNSLVDMYAKCGVLDEAQKVFDALEQRCVVSWNMLISGYVREDKADKAIHLFHQMKREGIQPNQITYLSLLKACSSIAALDDGKQIHQQLEEDGFEMNEVVGNALVDMYAKCGDLDEAVKLFIKLPGKTVASWNTLIGAYAQHGMGHHALEQFQHMQQAGIKPDDVTFVNVLNACSHTGLVTEGHRLFESMWRDFSISPTPNHLVCMVDLFGRSGHLKEASDFIHGRALEADATVWMSLLGACQIHGNLELGKVTFDCLLELEPQNAAPYLLMLNIYAATGRWEGHADLREKMVTAGLKKEAGRTWIAAESEIQSFAVRTVNP